jgi:hypothetical protein
MCYKSWKEIIDVFGLLEVLTVLARQAMIDHYLLSGTP